MEDFDFPVCILKLNLQCCEDSPSRIEKKLRKVKGVYATTIDPVKGIILVCGTADPSVLVKTIEKIGLSPQIYAYERDPTEAKTRFRSLLKRYATNKSQDEPTTSAPATAHATVPAHVTAPLETCPVGGGTFGGFGYPGPPGYGYPGPPGLGYPGPPTMMQMPLFTLPPRTGPPGWLATDTKPRLMVKYEEPKVIPRKPPAPYPFDFYESSGFPASNSPFKYFSDENPTPCTIM